MAYPKVQPMRWTYRNVTAVLKYALYDSENVLVTKTMLDDQDEIYAKIYDYNGDVVWEGTKTDGNAVPIEPDVTQPEGQQYNIELTLTPDESLLLSPGTYSINVETRKGDDNQEFALGNKLKVSEHMVMYTPKLLPTTHDFGNVTVGNPSTPQQFVVLNTTKTDITVTNINISGADAVDFSSNPSGTGSWTLAANGGTLDIAVIFTPSHLGAHTAALEVNYDASVLTAALTGTGV